MSDPSDVEPGVNDEPALAKPLVPRRTATPSQALLAIGLVFFFGLVIGFVLAQTL